MEMEMEITKYQIEMIEKLQLLGAVIPEDDHGNPSDEMFKDFWSATKYIANWEHLLNISTVTDEDKMTMQETLRRLVQIANDRNLAPEFVKLMQQEHRTHQQTLFRNILVPLMSAYAVKPNGQYDLRNEAVIKFCKSIISELENVGFPYI